MRVLVATSNLDLIREVYPHLIEEATWTVRAVVDLAVALRVIGELQPDVVVTDTTTEWAPNLARALTLFRQAGNLQLAVCGNARPEWAPDSWLLTEPGLVREDLQRLVGWPGTSPP